MGIPDSEVKDDVTQGDDRSAGLRGRRQRRLHRHSRPQEAMAEAEDTDSALEWTRHRLKKWGGDYKKILKGMPPLSMKDDGVSLAGARDLLGNKVKGDMMNDKELQMLAKAENRLAAAKQDVHEAQTATSGIKRAQLEDLAQELTEEAQHLGRDQGGRLRCSTSNVQA